MRAAGLDLPDPAPSATPRGGGLGPVGVILVCAFALAVLGLIAVFSATAFRSSTFFFKQILGLAIAIGVGLVFSRLDLEYCRRHVLLIAGGVLFLLLLVAIPGIGISVNGSRRWLGVGPIRFQVSELAKVGLLFVLAHYLALNQSRMTDLKRGFLVPLGIIGAFAGLNMLQPDFGTTALIAAIGVVLLFLAGARWLYILVSVTGLAGLFTVAVLLNPNRLARFLSFLDVEGNKASGTYQLYQAILAFASGGVTGVGLGQGRQQMSYLPEAHTDFIAAIVGEELGLVATLGAVGLFLTIFLCGLLHLRRAPNQFQYLLVAGCLLFMAVQAIVNLGVVTGLLPTKGMSLPFVSAGMSNLLIMGILVGIIVNTRRAWSREQILPGSRDFCG
jgi:cell division protein FtsW